MAVWLNCFSRLTLRPVSTVLLRSSRKVPIWNQFSARHRYISTSQTCFTSSNRQTNQTNESYREPSPEAKHKARMYSIATGAACAFFGASYILYLQLKSRAEDGSVQMYKQTDDEGSLEKDDKSKKKGRVSFHDQKVMGYEDRIRAYSTPDKIFRYFATLRVIEENGSRNIYMTPKDFIRSITPGMMQPQEWGLDLFRLVTLETVEKEGLSKLDNPDSVFQHMGYHGLISFSDYLFLLTIIATPAKNFELAFKMFDLNGDGEVELEEFETVRGVLRNSTGVGSRHRDHFINGNKVESVGGALEEHFFGPKGTDKLTVEKFQKFHSQLNTEILQMEFNRFDPEDGLITERDFTHFVVDHAPINDQKKKKIFKRIKKKYGSGCNPGISFEDVLLFNELMDNLSDIDMALGMYYAAGTSVSPAELKLTCEAVIGLQVNDHLLEVLFTLFDDNSDGELSRLEFITILSSRNSRGLQRPRELGFARLVNAVTACSSKTIKDQLGIGSQS